MASPEHNNWKGTTGGLPWMQRTLVRWLAVIDVRIAYCFVAVFVIPFYMLFTHYGYIAQYRFFREVFGYSWIKSFFSVYKNECKFSQIIIDRFAVYGGKKFKFDIDPSEFELWQSLESGEKGFVQLSAHIGNYEIAGYLLQAEHKDINALVFSGETQTVMTNRAKVFTPNGIKMVPVSSDMSHVFILSNALSNNEIISMPGDRMFGSKKYVECNFFSKTARFPIGPFQLSVLHETPIVCVFVMKKSYDEYKIIIRELNIPEGEDIKKSQKIASLVSQYSEILESTVKNYPTQWFNYFDFWNQ